MKKRIISVMVLLMCFSLIINASIFAAAVPKSVLKANDSVIRIITSYSDGSMASGSGFVVSSDKANTYIVTNHHVAVMDNPTYITVILNSEAEINANVVASDESRDLAVMKVAMPLGMEPLKLSKESAKKGDGIYVIGFPGDADIFTENLALNHEDTTITDGIVSALRNFRITDDGDPIDLIQVSAAINHGNSGGPVLDMQGQVVGVSTFTLGETSTDINGAVSVTEVVSFLQENGIPFTLSSGSSKVNPALIACVIVALVIIAAAIVALARRKKTDPAEAPNIRTGEPIVQDSIYHSAPEDSTQAVSSITPKISPKGKKHLPLKRIIPVALGTSAIILCVGGFLEYNNVQKAIATGDVNNLNPFFLHLAGMADGQINAYVDAVKLLNSGDFNGAEQAFSALSGYRDSDEMVLECQYRKGMSLLSSQKFEEATAVFEALGDYSDSGEMVKEVSYQQGLSALQNKDFAVAKKTFEALAEDPCYKDSDVMCQEVNYQIAIYQYNKGYTRIAYNQMSELAADGYQKAAADIETLREALYTEAVNMYREDELLQAEEAFKDLANYKDSPIYLKFIDISGGFSFTDYFVNHDYLKDEIDFLIRHIQFEDANRLVFIDSPYAQEFLRGKWETANGDYIFSLNSEDRTSYNIPEVKGGGTYDFSYGTYTITINDKEYKNFDFTAIDRNTIDIYDYADGYTYRMYRQ